jgi:hypothetical protein
MIFGKLFVRLFVRLSIVLLSCLSLMLIVSLFYFPSLAQSTVYNFSIPKVQIGNSIRETVKIDNSEFQFNDTLSPNDLIRFGWQNIDINLASKDKNIPNSGYFKAYHTEIKDSNFILDFGSSPLKVEKLAQSSLNKEGANVVYFQLFIQDKPTEQKIKFNYTYSSKVNGPEIKVIQPKSQTVFSKGKNIDIELQIENFIVKTGVSISNYGKLKVYLGSVNEDNFLTSIIDSQGTTTGSRVKVNSVVLGDKFSNSFDNEKTQLLFVPETNDGKVLLNNVASVPIIMNFQNTLDIKSPQVQFIDIDNSKPVYDRSDKLKFRIDNFKVLSFDTRNETKLGEGYVQILINDKPHKIAYTKQEFSIDDIAPSFEEEKVNLKIQLVDANFVKLDPVAETSVDIFIKKQQKADISQTLEISNYRLIIVGITVLLILGSVLYVIFRT